MCSLFGYFKEIVFPVLIPSPLVEGIMCMGGRDTQPPSVFLSRWLFNAACLLDSFLPLSLRRGTCGDEDAHFSLPWRARLQCCAINQKLRSCLGRLLTYFVNMHATLSSQFNCMSYFSRGNVRAISYDNLFW